MRLKSLGQEAGQAVLASLHPQIAELAAQAAQRTLDDPGGAALGADMAAMRQ